MKHETTWYDLTTIDAGHDVFVQSHGVSVRTFKGEPQRNRGSGGTRPCQSRLSLITNACCGEAVDSEEAGHACQQEAEGDSTFCSILLSN